MDQEDHLEAFILPYRSVKDLIVQIAGCRSGELALGEGITMDGHLASDGLGGWRGRLCTGGDYAWVRCGSQYHGSFIQVGICEHTLWASQSLIGQRSSVPNLSIPNGDCYRPGIVFPGMPDRWGG